MSCPDCATGGFLPGEPTGQFALQGAYFSPNPDGDARPSNRAILLLTDAFGLPLKNSKLMADTLAKRLQCDVWVPDLFEGKPILPLDDLGLPDHAGVTMSWWAWAKFIWRLIPSVPAIIASRPPVVDVRLTKFIKVLQEHKNYEKLGAVGYCFGGTMAVKIGGKGLVNSIVIAHPGKFTLDEVKAITVPASWICAEEDFAFKPAFRLSCEAVFAERKGTDQFVDYEFKDYKGTAHGFAARPNLALPQIKEAHESAMDQVVEWFSKTL